MPIVENVFLKFNSILEGDGADEIFNVGAEIDRIEKKTVDLLDPFVQQIKSSNKALAEATDIRKSLLILNQKIANAQIAYTKTLNRVKGIQDDITAQEKERLIRLNNIKRLEGQVATAQGKRKRELQDQLDIQNALAKSDIKYLKDKKAELDDVLEAQKNITKEAETAANIIVKSGGKVTDPTPKTSGGILKGGGVLDAFKERLGGINDAFEDIADVIGSGGGGGGGTGGGGGSGVISRIASLAKRFGVLGGVVAAVGSIVDTYFSDLQSGRDQAAVGGARVGGFFSGTKEALADFIANGRIGGIINPRKAAKIFTGGFEKAKSEADFTREQIRIRDEALKQDKNFQEVLARQQLILQDQTKSYDQRLAASRKAFNVEGKLIQDQIRLAKANYESIKNRNQADRERLGVENLKVENLQAEKDALLELDRLSAELVGRDRRQLGIETNLALDQNRENFNAFVSEALSQFGGGQAGQLQIALADAFRRQSDVATRLAGDQISQTQADAEIAQIRDEILRIQQDINSLILEETTLKKQNEILSSTFSSRRLRDIRSERVGIQGQIEDIEKRLKAEEEGTVEYERLIARKIKLTSGLGENERSEAAESVRSRLIEDSAYAEATITNTIERNQVLNRLQREANIEFLKIERDKYKESEDEYKEYQTRINLLTKENETQSQRDILENANRRADQQLALGILGTLQRRANFRPSDANAQRRQRDAEALLNIQARRDRLARERDFDLTEFRDDRLSQEELAQREANRRLEEARFNQSEAGLREAKTPLLRLFGFDRQGNNGLNAELEDEFDNAYKSLVNFGELFLAEAARQADVFVQIQERRVDTAARLFQRGNSDLINSEEAKLDTLTEAREKAVQRQRQLSAVQVAANQAVAISNTFVALTDALGKGFPASLVAFPLILGLVGQASSFALGLSSAFGDIPAFFKGTDKDVRSTLGQPHLRGRDGYIIRADGSEKILAGQYASQVSHMDQATLVANALAGERAKMFKGYGVAYTDEVNAAMEKYGGRNRQDDKMYREIVKMNDYLSNLKMDVRVDKDGFMASMQKRVNNINRIKRRKA